MSMNTVLIKKMKDFYFIVIKARFYPVRKEYLYLDRDRSYFFFGNSYRYPAVFYTAITERNEK